MIELHSHSPEQTRAIAAGVGELARPGDLIVLAGQMGAGKTAFAQGLAHRLGVTEPVTSPTYTLVHTYRAGAVTLHHADLYRLEHTAEVDDLALTELLEDNAIVLVEWGDIVDLGPHLFVEIEFAEDEPITNGRGESDGDSGDVDEFDPNWRRITITMRDPRWTARWERLEATVDEWTSP